MESIVSYALSGKKGREVNNMSHLRETGIKKLSTVLDNDIAMGVKAYCKEREIEFDSYGYYDKTGITILIDAEKEERINELIDYLDEIKIKNSLFFKKYGIDIIID